MRKNEKGWGEGNIYICESENEEKGKKKMKN